MRYTQPPVNAGRLRRLFLDLVGFNSPPGEEREVGLRGARALDPARLREATGFVLDASGPTGSIITAAPSHEHLEIRITGRPAHAGFAPEQGISAIQVAARAVAAMRLGRIDPET